MTLSILADENVERQAARYLEKCGHDVELVVDVLSPGVDDEVISRRADERSQVVLTSDSDFLSKRTTTLYVPNDELEAFSLAEIVDTIADHVDQEQLPSNTYVTDSWS
jgi:predicted nuclease of predicted toxin-antitoxin system